MIYHREFTLQAAHFNNEETYNNYETALKILEGEEQSTVSYYHAGRLLNTCLRSLHGHNFKVTIDARGEFHGDPKSWTGVNYLVDDYELSNMVMEWDNTNLSVLKEFFEAGRRATTEGMVAVLLLRLKNRWPGLSWKVSVQETDSISAVDFVH